MIVAEIGHMDAVCEIVDARIPLSSRNPDVDEMTADKPRGRAGVNMERERRLGPWLRGQDARREHGLRPRKTLLVALKDEPDGAAQLRLMLPQQLRCAKEHGRVQIVAAGVHGAVFRAEGEVGALRDAQGDVYGLIRQAVMLMIPTLHRIAGERLPMVLHVASRTVGTHAFSIFGDHSDVMNCRQTATGLPPLISRISLNGCINAITPVLPKGTGWAFRLPKS